MLNYLLSLIFTCSTIFVLAQQNNFAFNFTSNSTFQTEKNYTISVSYFKKEKDNAEKEAKKAKRLKISGLVFTSLGGAGILITTPLVIVAAKSDNYTNPVFGGVAGAIIGIMGYTPSVAFLAAGIPMTIVGFKKAKKVQPLKEF